ncbi:MAG: adenosylcobinamide-phosphate synthase CbiB [Acetatifactor sp.]|nr:adenosylcobinamide-phosphate synthase CbiB [Acetatifactor sp.]
MYYHYIALTAGFILDLIIGDPMNFPHPVRLMGRLISFFDRVFLGEKGSDDEGRINKKLSGFITVLCVVFLTGSFTFFIMFLAYRIHFVLGICIEAILTCYILAAKSLKVESMKVHDALISKGLIEGRKAVSMIVGRDTDKLSEEEVVKAAVETVAENTSDGVIAPLIYTFFFGPVGGMIYKSINTMDSMIGYKNDRYEDFGFFAAKLDDVVNFIPARISALFMIFSAFFMGKSFSGKEAFKSFKKFRFNSPSPNSAQTESACAGALGLTLGGDAYYFGKLSHKPFIGDGEKKPEVNDIKKANDLMFATEFMTFFMLFLIALTVYFLGYF